MHKNGVDLLNLMFLPGETICVSHNKYAYHSIPLENVLSGLATLLPTEESAAKRNMSQLEAIEKVDSSNLILVALNPIKGFRNDIYCTAFRNFLIEMDCGPLNEQMNYIKQLGMPYSAVVFSGGKSLHFLISLDKDLPNEKVYRVFTRWLLNIATLADQNCLNPSRSIRLPEAEREPGKWQRMVEYKGKVKLEELVLWLNKFPDCKPKEEVRKPISDKRDFSRLSHWAISQLTKGFNYTKGRNKTWFSMGCEFALAGYSEDDTLDLLREYFSPEHDFKEREWKAAVRSGFKHIYDRNR